MWLIITQSLMWQYSCHIALSRSHYHHHPPLLSSTKKQSNSSLTITDTPGTDPKPPSSASTIIQITADPMWPCHPLLNLVVLWLQVFQSFTPLALLWVFILDYHIYTHSIVAVNQTLHELQVAASISSLALKRALPAPFTHHWWHFCTHCHLKRNHRTW